MSQPTHLWLREETKQAEHRAALSPAVCKTLLDKGFKITVEKSAQRIFDDEEYSAVGCPLVEGGSWKQAPKDAYILGLKELPEGETGPLEHRHIFFAHCFKGQAGWKELIGRFEAGKGKILDLEFLNDERGRRVAAFGYYAGFTGAAFGLDAWARQVLRDQEGKGPTQYPAIRPFKNEEALIAQVKENVQKAIQAQGGSGTPPRILVIGALGRCGSGAVDCARKVGIPDEQIVRWDMAETSRGGPFVEITESDVFVNCIYLTSSIPPFVTQELLDAPTRRIRSIVDVSCDTTNPHNPIPIYSVNTTFQSPTLLIPSSNPLSLELMSIDHLPTALPREASDAFCKDLLPTLLELSGPSPLQDSRVWKEALELYEKKVQEAA
ncbi:saccharopine dehydrogenase Lys3 [Piptocephalis cylindrospora]|uniref:Saccharopine dehydrogenase [NAD(+), L-lysine-forming] n=1 Tax=Piptocephalis cylindrospora TaxID=1907219 RepID=A0A4P9Y3V3_9FUNG|nr:saccharopine dehydrogenase Lys3 [Piptocephalis cylindrospora]|eukprot:RKP13332.1 saccharopine dehydrogenase Lys3 [Piptocephalis cylindrospora]